MKINEYKDGDALDLLADIIEPMGAILSDKKVAEQWRSGKKFKAVSTAIKNHKKDVIEVMATLDGVKVEDYHFNALTLPMQIIELLNDEDLKAFFL